MTTPDPRTDLAGYLGLTDEQARICRQSAEGGYTGIRGKVGARLIEQDQARADEPDDGLIPVTVRLTVEEVSGEGESWDTAVDKLCDACAAIDLPAPLPPWKSPLADLPDLTEEQCCDAVRIAGEGPDSPVMWAQVGRALIAAGWTLGEEA
mgnify:CR=1 FL=1